ncbi:AzlC family ABC transporter permease [Dietzia aerolata]|uniref:AzlC family ABC transporter permease n=1 Tax=Dietzia aerolata TaxID=595984 RepID=A0ABV5JMD5_9ACTN|nr:AzlC family ABC transporter permease [Dietzia aerolata]HIW66893.1 AzlC family ABC transporter permease [Candidatus Dietzia merdigallinarum]
MSNAPSTSAEIRKGLADAAPVGLGLVPLGLAFGVLITQAGFDWWWAPVFSILIYAGSMEFLAIGMLSAATPLYSLAAATFLVNFRHVFYGLSFPIESIRSRLGRAYSIYALTDEVYAITATKRRAEMSGPRTLTIAVTCQSLWVLPGIVGGLIGLALPPGLDGLQFALTALFAVLAVDAWRASGDLPAPVIGLLCGLAAAWLAPDQMMLVGLVAFVLVLLARFAWTSKNEPRAGSGSDHASGFGSDSASDSGEASR